MTPVIVKTAMPVQPWGNVQTADTLNDWRGYISSEILPEVEIGTANAVRRFFLAPRAQTAHPWSAEDVGYMLNHIIADGDGREIDTHRFGNFWEPAIKEMCALTRNASVIQGFNFHGELRDLEPGQAIVDPVWRLDHPSWYVFGSHRRETADAFNVHVSFVDGGMIEFARLSPDIVKPFIANHSALQIGHGGNPRSLFDQDKVNQTLAAMRAAGQVPTVRSSDRRSDAYMPGLNINRGVVVAEKTKDVLQLGLTFFTDARYAPEIPASNAGGVFARRLDR